MLERRRQRWGGECGLLSVLLLGAVGWVFVCPHCSCLTVYPFGNRFCTTLLPCCCTGTCTILTRQERQQGQRRAYSSTDTQNSTGTRTIPWLPLYEYDTTSATNTRRSGPSFISVSIFRTNWVKRQVSRFWPDRGSVFIKEATVP